MDNKFDELTKDLAKSTTRRGALIKLGVGFAGLALAALGLATKAEAPQVKLYNCRCRQGDFGCQKHYSNDVANCLSYCISWCAG